MVVFLKKVRVKTIFTAFDPVVVEPLELCCLKSVLNNIGVESYIIDDLFNLNPPQNIVPDAIVLTGYNVAENQILIDAKSYRQKFPHAKIIAGGVHIQVNPDDFHSDFVDYVCHTPSMAAFSELIKSIKHGTETRIDGIDFRKGVASGSAWHKSPQKALKERENVIPDRSLFRSLSHKLHYMEKRNVALIKGSTGCPYGCSYCCCKLLNGGNYIPADYEAMTDEMEKISADYFWIVDDVLFSSRADALQFIEIINEKRLKVKIIGYLRADFILKHGDLLPLLRAAGLVEAIVGFEATTNHELDDYEKNTNALDYPKVISLLKKNNIDLTALFMVRPDYKIKDFTNLYKFIKKTGIEVYTVSMLTPLKGTTLYESMKDELLTDDPRKFDFLHPVLKTSLPKWMYILIFYGIQLRLVKSDRVRKYLTGK
ncbi:MULTISPECIES: B12-binding domain-containing radical SAM protein [unclassified Sedimentibacter]|uniref:B12-binding domain-containing radical SAM protein n=1 Tax=unclassified Sedimentibacter TaxID=2649220 RepID=UPI0027DF3EEB|nr:radical SAM protein [Sedimentibacter sp. MB35-C1]WMJ77695.1 hypothetical protein RBQ61_01855 [Sedimentibacter sp. MB35-C1]